MPWCAAVAMAAGHLLLFQLHGTLPLSAADDTLVGMFTYVELHQGSWNVLARCIECSTCCMSSSCYQCGSHDACLVMHRLVSAALRL